MQTQALGARNSRTNGATAIGESAMRADDSPVEHAAAAAKSNGHVIEEDDAKPSKGNFFLRLAQMNAEDWDRHRVYVYRRWPRISRDGQPHYIGVHREALDEERLRELYGSGRYLLKLNDQKRTIDQTAIEIVDIGHPPKLSRDELVDAPENQQFHKLWPAVDEKKQTADGNQDAGAVRELVGLLKTLMTDRVRPEADDTKRVLIDWALTQTSKDREQNSPGALAELIKTLKDIMPAQAKEGRSAENSEMLAVIAALKDMQPRPQDPLAILQQAKNLFGSGDTHGDRNIDEIDRLDKVLTFATKLASLRVHNAGDRGGWDIGLDYAKELLTPFAQLAQTWMLSRTGRMTPGAAPNAASPASPTAFDPYANPQAMRDHARAMNQSQPSQPSPAPGTAAPPNNANSQAASGSDDLLPLLQTYGALLLNALNSGMPGCDFAEHLSQLFGNATHGLIAARGEDSLAQTLLSIPEFAVFGEVRLRRFAHEFIHFEEILAEEQAEAANG